MVLRGSKIVRDKRVKRAIKLRHKGILFDPIKRLFKSKKVKEDH